MLWNNRKLKKLFMSNCKLDSDSANSIAEGLVKNFTLTHLDISSNKLKPSSLKKWADVIGKSGLVYLDVSFNDLENEGC